MRTHYRRPLSSFAAAIFALVLWSAGTRPAAAGCLLCSCTVATTSVNFGSYVLTNAAPATTTSSISFTCNSVLTVLGSVTISLSPGMSGSFANRTLKNGANALNYNLYLDAADSTIFGDGTAGTGLYNSGTFTLVLNSYSGSAAVFGRIPAGQGVPAGSYTDMITETISF